MNTNFLKNRLAKRIKTHPATMRELRIEECWHVSGGRKGINPFTGEETVFKAKPARNAGGTDGFGTLYYTGEESTF